MGYCITHNQSYEENLGGYCGDVVFFVRGCNYGGVERYMDLEENEKLPYFIRFCEKYNVEYVV